MLIATCTVFGSLFLLAGVLYLAQEKMIYHPRPYPAQVLQQLPAGLVPLADAAGSVLGFYRGPASGGVPRRLWLLLGGNADQALRWEDFAMTHAAPDVGYVMVEYPGYGACLGKTSPSSILAANEQAVALLAKHLGVSVEHIHAHACGLGHSLGAAALTQYAEIHPLQRLILISPFTTMKAMAQRSVGWPLCELLTHRFDNQKNLNKIADLGLPPTTIIHGARDGFIPPEMGRALAQAHPSITFVAVEGAEHNDVIGLGDAAIRTAMAE
jgi:uncharacterized protein